MERKAPPVQPVQLVFQGRGESTGHRDCMVSRVCQEYQDHPESQENQVLRVLLEKPVLAGEPDLGANEDLQEREGASGPTGCRDLKVVQVDQDQTGQRVASVLRVLQEREVVQDLWGCPEREVYPDLQAPREMQARLGESDWRGTPALTVLGDFLVLWDLLVLMDPMERRVKRARPDLQDAEAPEESLVLLVPPVPPAPLASPDPLVPMVNLGSKVTQVRAD